MPHDDGGPRSRARLPGQPLSMDTANHLADARLARFLAQEPVIWLSTVRPDGTPHLVPSWFAWDGETVVMMSKPGAQKVRNLRANASAMLALGDAEDDFDVGLLEATAERIEDSGTLTPAFTEKYAERIASLGLTPEQFAAIYSLTIRLTPTRALGWHGRSQPASVVAAARDVAASRPVSLSEPRLGRPGLREWLGEPLARGLRILRPTAPSARMPI
jgi:PPOX class probable F420-dependent enzyme